MARSDRESLALLQKELEELQEKIRLQDEEEKEPAPPPVEEQLATMRREIEELKGHLKGNRDNVASNGRTKPLTLPVVDINERVRLSLGTDSKNNKMLALELKVSEDKVKAQLQELRTQRKVFNIGFDDDQRWVWRVGDDVDGPVLRAAIKHLIAVRPMTLRDLVNATGTRREKVSGHMIEIQRAHDVIDLSGGDTHAKIYFLMSDKIQSARLAKKIRERKPESR